jgi:hypothetical protein
MEVGRDNEAMTALLVSYDVLQSWAPLALDPVPAPEDVQAGPMHALVVLSIIAACVLLVLSMRRHLRRIQIPMDGEDLGDEADRTASRETHVDPDLEVSAGLDGDARRRS